MKYWYSICFSTTLISVLVAINVRADEHNTETIPVVTESSEVLDQDLVIYPARYFERFRPVTALEMVNQVPGFQLDDNIDDVRGFSEVAGNVLINDRRPSTKRDSLSAMLARIPATSVQRIELIRGQVRGIDLRGQSTVINLILLEGIPIAIQWEAVVRQTFGHGPLKPEGRVSLSDTWKGIDINVGLDARRTAVGRKGVEEIYNSDSILTEQRFENRANRNTFIISNLGVAGWWGDTLVRFNGIYNLDKRRILSNSDRFMPLVNDEKNLYFDEMEEIPSYEAGIDLERNLLADLTAKAIFLYVSSDSDILTNQRDTDSDGNQTLYREADGSLAASETIGRVELDWSGYSNHLIQANIERAHNVLDSNLQQTDDTGGGAIIVPVPGANSSVEEIRWDFLLKDTWMPGNFELEYGVGAEASTISQTGDAEQERNFFFLKPQAVFTYSWMNRDQSRIRIAREIAQLNLENFVSSTVFLDDDLALGNPDIRPDATWKLEAGHEMRFEGGSVIKFTVFHHWISDVLDLLPIATNFEAPGNIGDGYRLGLQWDSTLPLDAFGLKAAKLNIKARWQDSSVTDPVTGKKRVLSVSSLSSGPIIYNVENKYGFEVNYRQDFQQQRVAWGWLVKERAAQYLFKVDELENYNEGVDVHAFVETTRWFGIKTQFLAENILNLKDYRERTRYIGERELSPLDVTEFRSLTRGVRLQIIMSGNF